LPAFAKPTSSRSSARAVLSSRPQGEFRGCCLPGLATAAVVPRSARRMEELRSKRGGAAGLHAFASETRLLLRWPSAMRRRWRPARNRRQGKPAHRAPFGFARRIRCTHAAGVKAPAAGGGSAIRGGTEGFAGGPRAHIPRHTRSVFAIGRVILPPQATSEGGLRCAELPNRHVSSAATLAGVLCLRREDGRMKDMDMKSMD